MTSHSRVCSISPNPETLGLPASFLFSDFLFFLHFAVFVGGCDRSDLVWAESSPMASETSSGGGRPEIPVLRLKPSVNQNSGRGSGTRVMGMLISVKQFKNNVVQTVLKEVWARHGPVRFTEVNNDTLMFDFESEMDRDQVLDLSPWSIHGSCLNLKLCPVNVPVNEINFRIVQAWVQVHDLSLEMINPENAESICSSIGRCIKV